MHPDTRSGHDEQCDRARRDGERSADGTAAELDRRGDTAVRLTHGMRSAPRLRRSVAMSVSSEADPEGGEGSAGLRTWRRSAAATLTGPARLSTPMTRLRKAAITLGPLPVRTWEASSAKVVSRRWCSASIAQCPRMRSASRAGPAWGW